MAKTTGFANAFTFGEVGELAWDRSDLQQHAKGAAEALNLMVDVRGPLVSRGGFWDRGPAANEAYPTRLVRFERSSEEALFLELGQNIARVWTPSGDLVMDGGDPYDFATAWTGDQAFRLWFKQIGDVFYVTHMDGEPTRVIQHLADDHWTSALFDFREGPWLPENQLDGWTLTASATTGVVTLTASEDTFTDDDIGSLFALREGDGAPGVMTWTSETDFVGGALCQFDGKVYRRVEGGEDTTGTTPPVHSSGTLSDGAVGWTFVHDGRGVVKITGVTSPTVASGTVVHAIPTTAATRYWARQAYSAIEGYPRALTEEREERLVFGSSLNRPGTVDATRTAGFGPAYGDFKPGLGTGRVVEDDAVRLNVGGTSRLIWLLSTSVLVGGCSDGEYILSGGQMDEPMTPQDRRAPPVSGFGNAEVAPLKVQGPPTAILHVSRSRKVLRETKVAPDLSVASRNLSVLAYHIFDRGIAETALQDDDAVWIRLDDGGLAFMRYDQEQQVIGVTRQPLPGGWQVESIATATAGPGQPDVLMASVAREKGGTTQRRIWRLAHRDEDMFLDGALAYAGAPVNTITGLDHLDGETVAVRVGDARIPDKTVEDGAIALGQSVEAAVVGLKMTRRFESLPLDTEGTGSTAGRTITPTHATVFLTAADALVGTDEANSAERVRSRSPNDLTGPATRRLRQRVGIGDGSSRDARIVIDSDAPFDLILHAYRLEADVQK